MGKGRGGVVPFPQDQLLFGKGQERQIRNALLWIGDNPCQQCLKMPNQPFDGSAIKEIRVIFEPPDNTIGAMKKFQKEIHLPFILRNLHQGKLQPA